MRWNNKCCRNVPNRCGLAVKLNNHLELRIGVEEGLDEASRVSNSFAWRYRGTDSWHQRMILHPQFLG